MQSVNRRFADILSRSCVLQCGTEETYKPSSPVSKSYNKQVVFSKSNSPMRRSSVARRSNDNLRSPTPRARSAERSISTGTTGSAVVNEVGLMAPNSNSNIHNQTSFEEGHVPIPLPAKPEFRRGMSDLFDTQQDEDDGVTQAVTEDSSLSTNNSSSPESLLILPTLPRFPIAETRNKNCWSEPPVSIFSVRGASYRKDKKKVISNPYIFQARGSDLFLADCTDNIDMSKISHAILGGQLRKKPTLAIIFHFPWGFMNLYFEIPAHLTKYLGQCDAPLDHDLTPSERAIARWLMGDTEYRNERLKLIPYVAEGPWAVRSLVTGRPALIGKKLPVSYELYPTTAIASAPLLTATLDIGNSSATAKRIVSVCRRYMSALTVDVGFVIQGETADELPEQMLGAVRVHGPDPLKAPKLNQQSK